MNFAPLLAFLTNVFCPLALLAFQEPVAHWHCNEGAGTVVNDFYSSETGELSSTVGWLPSQSGHALNFRGEFGGYVQIGPNNRDPIIRDGSDFSISVWLKSSDLSKRQVIYGHQSSTSRNYNAYWIEIYENGRPAVGLGNGTTFQLFQNLNGSHPIGNDEWFHWTVVLQGATLRSYINGELAVTKQVTLGGTYPKGGGVGIMRELIGAGYSGTSLNFDGHIDNLRVWNIAVSDKAVFRAYLNAHAHWQFEGNLVSDSNGDDNATSFGDTNWASGQPGESLKFGGAPGDYVQIGPNNSEPLIPTGRDFSISVWLNSRDLTKRQVIYGHQSSTSRDFNAYWLEIYDNGRPAVGLGNGFTHEIIQNLNGTCEIGDGEWFHWTVVLQGSTLRSYINGELAATKQVTLGGVYPQAGSVGIMRELIGSGYSGSSLNFDGRIDDLRVWQESLDGDLINEVFYASMFDVRDWGAVGDAITDDGQAINQALEDLADDHKVVLLEDGIFLTNQVIRLRSKTKLYARNALLKNGTRSEFNDHDPPVLDIHRRSGCEVRDLAIDCNMLGVEGLAVRNSTDVLIQNCSVENVARNTGNRVYGMYIRQGEGEPCSDIRFQSCFINNIHNLSTSNGTTAASRGIMISSIPDDVNMTNIVIDNCTISNIRANNENKDGDCIQIIDQTSFPNNNDPWHIEIKNCTFESYSKRGIKCQAGKCLIANNYFSNPDFDVTWAPAIAIFASHSRVELNLIDYERLQNANGVTISGNNNEFFDNHIFLSPKPDPEGRSSGFHFFSSHVGRGNVMRNNVIIGGEHGLSVYNPEASGNEFTDNVIDVVAQPYNNTVGADNISSPNTLPWGYAIDYVVGDRVLFDGSEVYECILDHANVPPGNETYWRLHDTIDRLSINH